MKSIPFLLLFCFFTCKVCSQIIFDDNSMRAKIVWLSEKGIENRSIFKTYLEECDLLGLDSCNYEYDFNEQSQLTNLEDSVAADQRITMAVKHFFYDVAYGRNVPKVAYNGLNDEICQDISTKILKSLNEGTFKYLLQEIEPASPEYIAIKKAIAQYTLMPHESTPITSYIVDSTNHPLIEKLYSLGFLDTLNYQLPEIYIRQQLRKAQHLFELYEDGGLRPGVFDALNVPLSVRIQQLKQSLNVFRWLNCYRENKQIIVVNIPSANLFFYQGNSILLSSHTVVGRRATPTPTLCSKVTELVMYPYWTVPYSIATKELLPAIRNNISYLAAGNYQVLDKQGVVLNPYDINWKALSSKNFPYTIRQANGCDNSLGIMKLNFFTPYDVYLHDTPWKNFFSYNQRYFSHGCIRVEEAMALARLVMPARANEINHLAEMKKTSDGKPVIMKLKDPIPVFVLYQVAWPDENGMIRFFKDVYGKYDWIILTIR
ncbi:Murein L,D-transpeptidase YcbB/YkuD [Chitinophaga sp. CF118]|uniref:L,D-transpeptidase family protein n=1 Tax=Chitinophaga sp. CF118 TaxID=1884367 RepID=UPI0008F37C5C|nr:L,D-transpeptidase family protein [Chitinophaga sp. CF118]SFD83288.1 Murein L,D-transpeptidase YcbB/YkuD [Chitinophaga sp. CF118]